MKKAVIYIMALGAVIAVITAASKNKAPTIREQANELLQCIESLPPETRTEFYAFVKTNEEARAQWDIIQAACKR